MFGSNKKDPLVDTVSKVMQENQLRRDVERQFNEDLGIQSKKALPFEKHAEYDRVLAEKTQYALNEAAPSIRKGYKTAQVKPITGGSTAEYEKSQKKEVSEDLKGNQTKIDANRNNKIDAQDFKILKARKGLDEEDAYDYDRYLVKGGKAVKNNPKMSAEKDGPNHVHASSAEHAMKKFAAKKRVNEASSSDPDFGPSRPDGSKREGDIEFKPAPDSNNPEGGVSKEPSMPLPPKRPPNLKESAPKGEKFERMIKHIKDKYSKDGKLTDKEKSIAYATAGKAKNKESE